MFRIGAFFDDLAIFCGNDSACALDRYFRNLLFGEFYSVRRVVGDSDLVRSDSASDYGVRTALQESRYAERFF